MRKRGSVKDERKTVKDRRTSRGTAAVASRALRLRPGRDTETLSRKTRTGSASGQDRRTDEVHDAGRVEVRSVEGGGGREETEEENYGVGEDGDVVPRCVEEVRERTVECGSCLWRTTTEARLRSSRPSALLRRRSGRRGRTDADALGVLLAAAVLGSSGCAALRAGGRRGRRTSAAVVLDLADEGVSKILSESVLEAGVLVLLSETDGGRR